jgi:hypothetical protein
MHPQSPKDAPPNPGLVFELVLSYQRTAALKAAVDLDLFRAIGQGPGDVASIARHCSASERGVRILCDFLTINGVLAKEKERYRHTPTSALFLDPTSPASMASVAQFMSKPELLEPYQHLADVVRAGRTSLPGSGTVEPENPVWVDFAQQMAPMMGPMAPALDIAAGHGLFGIEIAKQNPEARVTGVDWAPVLRVALDNAKKAGVGDRYDMLPGSAFDVDFKGPYDTVLLTNFLHHFDTPTCVSLLKKVHGALRPGGRAVTLEFVPDEDRISPPMPAGFALTMLASTAAGDAYTLSELTAMHREAGYAHVSGHPIPMSPHTIVIGRA